MSERIPMLCDNCGRNLWIRLSNVGRIGKCKYCGYLFEPRMGEAIGLTAPTLSRAGEDADDRRGGTEAGLTTRRRRLAREALAALPQKKRESGNSAPFDLAPSSDRPLPPEHRWEAAHSPVGELRSELAALRDRSTQVDLLKQRLQTELDEIEQIHAQIQEAHSHFGDPEIQERLDRADEVEALRNECDRLRQETQTLRSQMEAQSADEVARTSRYEETRAECERLEAALQAQASQDERTRNQLGAEREAMVRELEALQDRIEGLERAHDEADYEHHQDRIAWEEERQERDAWSERRRQELLEAEQRASELRVQYDSERQAWEQQRDEHLRRIADADARLLDAGSLQERTAGERDANHREVDRLSDLLATRERTHAEAEARWGADREQLEAQREQLRRELVEDAERRIDEFQAQFEAERQAWEQQRDEHAQIAALWESLAQEVEQDQARLVAARDALGREVQELRSRLSAAEVSRTEADAQLVEARAAWEAERQALNLERDEHLRRIADAEVLQERTAGEREATTREVQRLSEQLATLEQARDAAEAEWEAERQALQTQREQQRRELVEDAERRIDELHAQLERERQAWEQQCDELERRLAEAEQILGRTARDRDARAQEVERLDNQIATLERARAVAEAEWDAERLQGTSPGGDREPVRDALEAAVLERDRLRRQLEETERSGRVETDRLVAVLDQLRRESTAAAQRGAEEVRTVRAELERQRADHEARADEHERRLVTLRRAWEVERRRWLELLAAAGPESLPGCPDGRAIPATSAARTQDAPTPGATGQPIGSPSPRRAGRGRAARRDRAETPLRARPQAGSYRDPALFRSHLEQWLDEAQARLQALNALPGQAGNEGWASWLEYEIRTAREEIALGEQAEGPGK